uniref:Uncharacterized protein n=1 Tax=Setaria digitata TaxID=48799 RepID=A0A915PEY5_9BILA
MGIVSLLIIPVEKLVEVVNDVKSARGQNRTREVCDESDQIENWNIYCAGEILSAMNLHRVELDSKTFVDRPLKKDPS